MPRYSRRAVLLTLASTPLASALAAAAAVSIARADDYPSRPVKIIVPFGAGGPTDVYIRDIAAELQQVLHQAFVMENRPGAGTTIGTEFVANATPDGYTLLMVSGTQTVNETLYQKKSYQLMRDLVPIAPLHGQRLGAGRAPFGAGEKPGRAYRAGPRQSPERSTTARRGPARTTTWPPSF